MTPGFEVTGMILTSSQALSVPFWHGEGGGGGTLSAGAQSPPHGQGVQRPAGEGGFCFGFGAVCEFPVHKKVGGYVQLTFWG